MFLKLYTMTKSFLFVLTACLCTSFLSAQDTIELRNPSFEDFARHSYTPKGWYDCGFENESPPDVHPAQSGGEFKVTQAAFDKNTYLGLVVRDNETWEAVGQRLRVPLRKGKCYEFSIQIARSILYRSQSRITSEAANYATPCRLRIWAGNSYCNRAFLLGETKEITNTRWLRRDFKFEPDSDYYYIMFEAYYKTPILAPYNGNILLDNSSGIRVVPCDEDEQVIADNDVTDEDLDIAPPVSTPPPTTTRPQPKPPVEEEPVVTTPPRPVNPPSTKTLAGIERSQLTAGKKIRLDRLFFEADKADIQQSSYEALDEVYEFLDENEDVTVEVGGHTNSIPAHPFCDSLSTARAKAVADYLIAKGIASSQIEYKGYGKRDLLVKNERSIQDRRKNQRVEIKILNIQSR
jgi:outer membrane protein OmpA-like peptidoglycan-associated protein